MQKQFANINLADSENNEYLNSPIYEVQIFGYCENSIIGELVFTTGMVGYIETITDPSYQSQIIVFSNPLIGNTNVKGNFQSFNIVPEAIIVQEFDENESNCQQLIELFFKHKKMIIVHPDTRSLIKLIREKGSLKCNIDPKGKITQLLPFENYNYEDESVYNSNYIYPSPLLMGILPANDISKKCCIIDCGYKLNIAKELKNVGFKYDIIDWENCLNIYDRDYVFNYYDAFVITNGPGNPEKYSDVIKFIKKLIEHNKKFLGICLGHQLVALAYGLQTYKMDYGHRSHNQPVEDLINGINRIPEYIPRFYMTSQNHGYCVKNDNDAKIKMKNMGINERFINMNDYTNEGLCGKNFITTQFHPECNSGPNDTKFIFKQFYNMVANNHEK